VVILKSVFSTESSDAESSDYKEMVDALLNAATFSKSDDGSEKGMSFEDFRSWCSLVPTIRKFLGSLLMPPSTGLFFVFSHLNSFLVNKIGKHFPFFTFLYPLNLVI